MAIRSRGGPRALAAALPDITRRAFARRGFSQATIVTDWPVIVGPALAAQTVPERLVFPGGRRNGGTLHIRVGGAFALELQHLEPLVIERINRHFGYGAVARLSLVQGPVEPPEQAARAAPEAVTEGQERDVARRVSAIGDDTLRQSLLRLGRSVVSRQERSKRRDA